MQNWSNYPDPVTVYGGGNARRFDSAADAVRPFNLLIQAGFNAAVVTDSADVIATWHVGESANLGAAACSECATPSPFVAMNAARNCVTCTHAAYLDAAIGERRRILGGIAQSGIATLAALNLGGLSDAARAIRAVGRSALDDSAYAN